jgi:squalene synthase HpnC
MLKSDSNLGAAYAECRRVAQEHYENFPVASYLVPRSKRDALAAIYAFARCADDFADEFKLGEALAHCDHRLSLLTDWRRKLDNCFAGNAGHPVFIALNDSARKFDLSHEHFEDLLRAFESDVRVNRYEDFASLLRYCAQSANPVGRLVLELFTPTDQRNPVLFDLSDDICTALQLANFWQDVRIDLERDRAYLPLEDLRRFNLSLEDVRTYWVDGGQSPDDRWTGLMAFEIARTREYFERGSGLPELVSPELRLQLRLTWLGGMSILSKIESVGYDVFRRRPSLTRMDFLKLYFRARRGRSLKATDTKDQAAVASHP